MCLLCELFQARFWILQKSLACHDTLMQGFPGPALAEAQDAHCLVEWFRTHFARTARKISNFHVVLFAGPCVWEFNLVMRFFSKEGLRKVGVVARTRPEIVVILALLVRWKITIKITGDTS